MSRIVKRVTIEGKSGHMLFDTGAFHSYVRREYVEDIPKRILSLAMPYRVGLGGETIEVKEVCIVMGEIEGLPFEMEAIPLDDLGRVNGNRLDAIMGSGTMEKWEMKLSPKTGELDLEGLRRREFIEY
ncbi:MAG: retropepsin-like aspartic protease [bacterium]